ncbi:MAG: helix-turn-helix transcriptional regulator [Cyclobacteriaceae bacterium]
MDNKRTILLPKNRQIIETVGEQIKLARLRRKLSGKMVAERAGIGRNTLISIEQGKPSVSIGHYFNVLNALGLEKDFLLIAKDDELGRKLQDVGLTTRARAPKKK